MDRCRSLALDTLMDLIWPLAIGVLAAEAVIFLILWIIVRHGKKHHND